MLRRQLVLALCAGTAAAFTLRAAPQQGLGCTRAAAEDEAPEAAEETPVEVEAEMDTTEKFDATAELKVTIAEAEKNLKSKRFALSRTKDAASDAGQKGMYRLAAEIETYKRNSATSTTATTNAAKRDVMRAFEKMLTAFEEIGASLAPADEGETKLAGDFEKVYVEFMEKFTKFGMSPFEPAAGDNFDKVKHEVVESVDGDGDVDTVLESKRRGYQTASGDVVRKARCTVSKARAAAATDAEPAEEAAEEKAE